MSSQFHQAEQRVGFDIVRSIIRDWPKAQRNGALSIVQAYDCPHEVSYCRLIWHLNSPWKRTVILRDAALHKFPFDHLDFLEQTVEYQVPLHKVASLFEFNGSLLIDRTSGELTSRCNAEPMNIMILNLAHEILIEKISVAEARKRCARLSFALRMRWSEEITQSLSFPTGATMLGQRKAVADPDITVRAVL